MIDPEILNRDRIKVERQTRDFIKKLKRRPPENLNEQVRELDEEVFEVTDCTKCANCCKTISPVFKERDITRLATRFRIKPGEFVSRYLYLDKDGDYVLKSSPCAFLNADNLCTVYDDRPAACRSYPHTGNLEITRSWDLFVKNSAVCPAVYAIALRLKEAYNSV